jgi:class 3 adenylate cyclase/tetratricopeptide (TPR) repeat protein
LKCPRCQQENPANTSFCGECGARLAASCSACGAINPPANKFCGKCGAPLTAEVPAGRFASPESYTPKHLAEKILTSKSALEGERKQVTVLFADLKGSMELLADRDPEEARKILDPLLDLMMEAVHRYEGTVNQVMGDGIMALFGAPVAHEDHAVRACYAALRMQESVKKYAGEVRRSHAAVVKIRVGLNSGEVVVRAIGNDLHMDYTAVGQTTHLAARMEQLADPGAIVIAPDTLALVEGYVDVRPLGPVPVKGLADPIGVYELTGAGPARTRLQASTRRGLTRFVGRDAELEQLRRALQLAGHGHGQVVAIVGEAGVGKSRLVYEFTHSHRLQGWLVLESTWVSYGKATSYLPVIELLKGYFRIQSRDDAREIREKVTGKLLTLDQGLRPALSPLLALLDLPVDDASWPTIEPAQRRQRTFDAVKGLLLREAREQPVLLIFEDLHWIDGETQALLDNLIESVGSARLMLLVNYRPEYRHNWGGKTYYGQMRLDSLPAESAGELLEALLGDDPRLAPLKQLLVKRGNPFFLEETVRTLVETKALVGERGRYRLTQPLQTLQVPPTVQTILAARIDRLSSEDKRLLQTASVVGKDVPFALLQAIAELPDEPLRGGLDRLLAAEFLNETGLYPDLQYSFKHALTLEVAYGGLLQERRRELHARIISVGEKIYVAQLDDKAEWLALHAVRGEVWESAVAYLQRAARRATARSANHSAAQCLEDAIAALEHFPPSEDRTRSAIDLRIDLRHALTRLGQVQRTLDHLRVAERLAAEINDRRRLGRVVSFITNCLILQGRYQEGIATGQRALAIAEELNDIPLRIATTMYCARARLNLGENRAAIELLQQVLHSMDTMRGDDLLGLTVLPAAFTFSQLALGLAELGEFDNADTYEREAVRRAEASGQSDSIVWAYWGVGCVALLKGRAEVAVSAFERLLTLCRSHDLQVYLPRIMAGLGCALARAGRVAEGLPLLEQAVTLDAVSERRTSATLVLTTLAEGYVLAGQLEAANRAAHQAVERARSRSERGAEAYALWILGIARSRLGGDIGAAAAALEAATAIADELGLKPLTAHCELARAEVYALQDDQPRALQHRELAFHLLDSLAMRSWLPTARP